MSGCDDEEISRWALDKQMYDGSCGGAPVGDSSSFMMSRETFPLL